MANLTQTFAKRVKAPNSGYKIHYDGGLRGFGLRVTRTGAKSFVLNYWLYGRERRYTIGQMAHGRQKRRVQKHSVCGRSLTEGKIRSLFRKLRSSRPSRKKRASAQ